MVMRLTLEVIHISGGARLQGCAFTSRLWI